LIISRWITSCFW